MELFDYINIIKKNFFIFWGIIFSMVFLALFTVYVQPDIYQSEYTLLISRQNTNHDFLEEEEEIKEKKKPANITKYVKETDKDTQNNIKENVTDAYDYFYRLEANGRVVQILNKTLRDKSFLFFALNYNEKQISPEEQWILKKIKGEILGPGYFRVIIKAHSPEKAQKTAEKTRPALENHLNKLVYNDDLKFKIFFYPLVTEKQNKAYFLVGMGATFSGLLIALLTILLVEYFNDMNMNKEKREQ